MNVTVIASNRRKSADCVTARPPCVMLKLPPTTANYVADRRVRTTIIRKARTVAAIILSISLRSFSALFRLVCSNTCAHLVQEGRHSIIRRVRLLNSHLATTVPPIYLGGYSALASSVSSVSIGSELSGAAISRTVCSISAAIFAFSFRKRFEFSRPCPSRVSP